MSNEPTTVRCMGFGKPANGYAYLSITRKDGTTELFDLTLSLMELICIEAPAIRHSMAEHEKKKCAG